ncbi:MAG: family acetyltransferase [Paenibacillus sp.]|jgi:ribosomal protein S18 acetylase RimI-like enzyme|nr:family acetyltransferase [Paenibacillus sp.]
MIRTRYPRRDDRTILALIKRELFPYALVAKPDLRWEPVEVKRRLNRDITFVAAPGRLKAVGFVSMQSSGSELMLDMLAVDRNSQGRGLGSALLQHSEKYGQSRGCRSIRLFVDDTNGKARTFYKRHGYYEEAYYPSMRCFLMRKQLKA